DPGELTVSDWHGRYAVHRSMQRRGCERMQYHAEEVVERDPAHTLRARADASTKCEPKRREHQRQRSAAGAEHDPDAQVDDADATRRRRRRRGLPLAADVGEKAAAGATLL